MLMLNLIYDKLFSVINGLLLALLLSIHIIMLNLRKNISRKIQLFIMDIHAAFSIPFFLGIIINSHSRSYIDSVFILLRFIIFCFEIILIYILTDEEVIKLFNNKGTED